MPDGEGSVIKRWLFRHKIITVVAVVILLVLIAAASGHSGHKNTASPATKPTTAKPASPKIYRFPDRVDKQPTDAEAVMNETVTEDGLRMAVNSVQYLPSLSSYEIAGPGQTYIVISVSLENTGKTSHSFDAKDFAFQDSSGQTVGMTYATMANPLDYGDLAPGAKTQGQVTFLAPVVTDHQYVLWRPSGSADRGVVQIK